MDLLNTFLELSDFEKEMSVLFTRYPEVKMDTPWRGDLLMDKLMQLGYMGVLWRGNLVSENKNTSSSRTLLTEEKDFPSPTDIGLYKHIRYLPAIWHSHSYFEIICVLHGNAKNYIQTTEYVLEKGDLFIVAPETSHALSVFDDDTKVMNITVRSSTFSSIFFDLLKGVDILSGFFKSALYGSPDNSFLLLRTGEDPVINEIIQRMWFEFKNNEKYCRRMLNAYFTQLTVHLLRTHEDQIILSRNEVKESENIQQILRYIRTSYKELTLQDVASKFGYSERHMSRLIKSCTGETLNSLINSLKLQEATRLFADEKNTIQQAAAIAGYASINTFYRSFHKKYGVTPLEYLKNHSASTC